MDRRALVGKLFEDNRDRLQQYLHRRLANGSDAQELAQEAYLRLLRIKRIDLVRNPQAYLYRIARNLLHELYTGQHIDADGEITPDELKAQEPSPMDAAMRSQRQEMIERAVNELPLKCQAALLLHWREGLTQAEIAEKMGLSRQMVQKYLATGLAHCQKRLRQVALEERGQA